MSTDLNFDVRDLQRKASITLGAFAVDTLRDKKWITKSYTSNFPFSDDHAAKQSQGKLFKILLRELLKAFPILKDESNPRYIIKRPEVTSLNAKVYLAGIDSVRLSRYAAMLNRRLTNNGLNGLRVVVQSETHYKAWDPFPNPSYSLYLTYNYFRPGNNFGNPYRLFLILDDILKVLSTLSKYTTVLDTETTTLFPLYMTQRLTRIEFEEEMRKTEAEKALLKIKTPKKKPTQTVTIPFPNVGTTGSTTTLYYTGGTATTNGTGTGTTTGTDFAWPNTARR